MAEHEGESPKPPGRFYLAVPYQERAEARKLGARWDWRAKRWYAPPGALLSQFARWTGAIPSDDPIAEFAAALAEAGLRLDGPPIMDGALHRVPVEGDRHGAKSGAYVGHLDRRPAGFIQNFKTGTRRNWKVAAVPTLTAAERARLVRAIAAERENRAKRREVVHAETCGLLVEFLAKLPFASRDHPYLQRKSVDAHGLLRNTAGPLAIPGGRAEPQRWSAKSDLILPVRDVDGQLISAQAIDCDGRKTFPRGGRIGGGMHLIGDHRETGLLVIAEGYATAATIHELTGLATAVAFHAGNLEKVARALRQDHPDLAILIAGDNDHRNALERMPDGNPKPNAGRIAAENAASAIGGAILLPAFAPDDRGTDWNDLAARGDTAFYQQWEPQIEGAMERLAQPRKSHSR